MVLTIKNTFPPRAAFKTGAAVCLFAFVFTAVILIQPHTACAQKSLEKGAPAPNPANARVPDASPGAAADAGLVQAVKKYFDSVFAKNYEEAVGLMPKQAGGDDAIARIEKWRERFMSPSNLKVINVRDNGDGTLTATATFDYMNANGVKDIMREKVVLSLSGGKYAIKSHPSAENLSRGAQPPAAPAARTGSPAGYPVTMTPASQPAGPGAGVPNMASLLSALNSGSAGAAGANIDPGELLGLMNELVNDPDVLSLASNPRIMEIAKDPSMMSILLSGNMTAIEANPKVKELLSDPAIRKIIEKVAARKENPSSSGDGQTANPPSSVNGIDVDKIFD